MKISIFSQINYPLIFVKMLFICSPLLAQENTCQNADAMAATEKLLLLHKEVELAQFASTGDGSEEKRQYINKYLKDSKDPDYEMALFSFLHIKEYKENFEVELTELESKIVGQDLAAASAAATEYSKKILNLFIVMTPLKKHLKKILKVINCQKQKPHKH